MVCSDDLWRKHGPQTLNKAIDFIGRVVKDLAEGTSMKRAVLQTLIDYTKPTLLKGGIREYNFYTQSYLNLKGGKIFPTMVKPVRTLGLRIFHTLCFKGQN